MNRVSMVFSPLGLHGPEQISMAAKAITGRKLAEARGIAKIVAVSCVLLWFQFATSVWAAERQVAHTPVLAAGARSQPITKLQNSKRLDLAIALPLRNREALTNLLRQIYDPVDPNYRHYLSPEQFAQRFGPAEKDYEAVLAFARTNGLTVTGTHPNRTVVDVNGTVSDIERAFHATMRVYKHPVEARNFYAPENEPTLDLAVPLLSISGLDDFVLPRPMGLISKSVNARPEIVSYATGSGPRGNFIGRDFRTAYAPDTPWDGAGESVGLFELDGYYASDIVGYENLAGLPNVFLTNVLLNGSSGTPGGNNIEVALDIDMAISMAPRLSKVIVYEGFVPNDILNRMATDNQARQLSSSWGFGPQVDPAREQIFMQYAAQGQSFFQASGDLGAWPGPIFPPSDDPYVTVVGGTSLTISNSTGEWLSETAWDGSGGGISTSYPSPNWQQGLDMSGNQGSATMRNVPDVAAMADVAIWLIANNGEQFIVGGTSAAAPLWAGFMALANQKAATQNKPSVGFANPTLYAIGQGSGYAQAFHDITTGNNTNGHSPGKFFAVQGYDLCTGWGTPTGNPLIDALLAPPDALRITAGTPLNFSGPPGGPFSPAALNFSLTNTGAHSLNWALVNSAPWLRVRPGNGTLLAGGPASTINLILRASATILPAGNYSATIAFTNLNSSLVQARQVILDVTVPPLITSQPADQAVREEMSASFTVGTASNGSLSFQWRQDNGAFLTNLTDGGNVFGSRSNTLVISNVSQSNVGAYSVVVSNAQGVALSSNAFLSILPWRPLIVAQPTNRTALPEQTITLNLGAVGSQPLVYQWLKNGVNLTDGSNLAGSSTTALTISNVSAADAGSYAAVVSNALGTTTSSNAVLSVVAVTAPGVTMNTLYPFTGAQGANPNGLLLATNNALYGTTQNGGTNLAGTIFRFTTNGLFTSLYSFTGGNDGASPFAALAQGPDGNFYGSAFQGGASDNGTLFRMTSAGLLSTLVSFNIGNGDFPYAQLLLGADSNFYGTSYQGGAFGRGTVFRVGTNGTFTTLYSFSNGGDGGHLAGNLVQAADGSLYGTTYKGGTLAQGTVFQLKLNGQLNTLFSFDSTNGAFPFAGLARGTDGNFYGVTTSGGPYGRGTVFRITPAGQFTNLYSFIGGSDGANPRASLLSSADGNFYGTTTDGGVYGLGTAFVISPDGALLTLIQFDGYNGANPQAALVRDAAGNFYGTTRNGGASGQGTVFRFGTSFSPQITSQPANQSVFEGANVSFYVSVLGGVPLFYQWQKNGTNLTDGGNISGTLSRILTLANVRLSDAGSYSVIVSNTLGTATSTSASLAVTSSPPYIVLQPTNQTLAPGATATFAVTAFGSLPLSYRWQQNGSNLFDGGAVSGSRTNVLILTKVTETNNGTYAVVVTNALGSVSSTSAVLTVVPVSAPGTRVTTLHSFRLAGPDGDIPNGLARGSNGLLYGTSSWGGAYRFYGTAFSLTTNGIFTTLVSFHGTNGSKPEAALTQGVDGDFYGTTQEGGTNDLGTVFRMTPDGMITILHSFEDFARSSYSALVQAADGNFYGSALDSIFRITPDGVFTNLYTFTGDSYVNGPVDTLAIGTDGNFYGMVRQGGAYTNGAIFRMTPDGSLTNIYSFSALSDDNGLGGPDGWDPTGPLVQGPDGAFYGTTKYYATNVGGRVSLGDGTVFRITREGTFTTVHRFPGTASSSPSAGVVYSSDGNFYGTTHGADDGPIEQGPSIVNGTLFRLAPNGSLSTLLQFDGFNDGARPETPLLEGPDGSLYGTTSIGGPGGRGTIFKLSFTSAPQITSQPANQTALIGANLSFSVSVFGARPLSYQWRMNGNNLSDSAHISGSTSRVLTLFNVSAADAATYSVVVSNDLGSVISSNALLTVVSPPVFQSISRTGGVITLTWTAMAQQKYRLQYNSDLGSTNWINLGSAITATNDKVTVSDVIDSPVQKFYRVVLLR